MNAKLQYHQDVQGWYKIEAIRPDGTRRVLADWFPNLITNIGMDRLAGSGPLYDRCVVGSGSTAPAFTDTALAAFVGVSLSVQSATGPNGGAPDYYFSSRVTYRFAAGTATGNLTEVGVSITNNTSLFSRALIVDSGGTPITITVLSDEILDVTYELRSYPTLTDSVTNVTISSVVYSVTRRVANVAGFAPGGSVPQGMSGDNPAAVSYSGAIGPITGAPATASGTNGTSAWSAYTNGTFSRTMTITGGLAQMNAAGGLRSMMINGSGLSPLRPAWQFEFSPVLPKDATKTLSLTVVFSWSRR